MILALELVLPMLSGLLNQLTGSNAPGAVIDAVSSTIDALTSHKADLITKANLEAQRG